MRRSCAIILVLDRKITNFALIRQNRALSNYKSIELDSGMAATSNANEEIQPSAPPAWMAQGPPSYDAVASPSHGYPMSRGEQFTESLQTAGTVVQR